jgi:hypothetical protein
MVEQDNVPFKTVGEAGTGFWTYSLHLTNSTLATVLTLIPSARASC